MAAGLLLRMFTVSDLWLDEALTVNIAKLPLTEIPAALRRDGAPPLYYWLLHLWMWVFGDSDLAVRALSGVASAATLPVVWLVGRSLGGRPAAWGAAFVLAVNPFAIRYATESRMYALIALEVALGLLAALRALDRPSPGRLAWVALAAAAVLYTHYWGLYLMAAAGLVLVVRAWRRAPAPGDRDGWRERFSGPEGRTLAALAVGGAAWAPWLPTFLEQAAHTGTPWATPVGPSALITVLGEFGGGNTEGARVLSLLLATLVLLGLLGRALGGSRVELDLRGRPAARPLFAIFLGCPAIAVMLGLVSGSAFVGRYSSVVLPFFAVLAGLGVAALGDSRRTAVTLGAVGLMGLALAGQNAFKNRTQAGDIAGYVAAAAQPGDVLAFCPDQLGPATLRLLGSSFASVGFPRADDARLIDWYDYDDVNKATSPAAFAKMVDQRAGAANDIWLVSSHGYRTAEKSCTELENRLLALRPNGRQVVRPKPTKYFEEAALLRYPA
ncbi:MAG: membrane protein-like [uncultured Acidimicrobiales bacterium]|uniref:Membrane protein-like n=1 Tax=uncultured Acidimicrobiales bacterium TaxID=310071 RepID=A0A6J4ITI4_9ACTN|nr:MAG: membrane protein-like [uncultured Acidimicrobiales bacterium]